MYITIRFYQFHTMKNALSWWNRFKLWAIRKAQGSDYWHANFGVMDDEHVGHDYDLTAGTSLVRRSAYACNKVYGDPMLTYTFKIDDVRWNSVYQAAQQQVWGSHKFEMWKSFLELIFPLRRATHPAPTNCVSSIVKVLKAGGFYVPPYIRSITELQEHLNVCHRQHKENNQYSTRIRVLGGHSISGVNTTVRPDKRYGRAHQQRVPTVLA